MTTGYLDNFYARLGVPLKASPDQIREAYHKAARRLHPDTNSDPRSTELFLQIQEAYEVLSDQAKRAAYDAKLPGDIDSPPNVMVNTTYSRSVLPAIDNPQLVYVLLDLMALPEAAEDAQPDNPALNICLILDTSTSMAGGRIDMVKSTAIEMVRALQPTDYLSVVAFNDFPEVIVPSSRGFDIRKVEARIRALTTAGGTEIYKALKTGFDEISTSLNPGFINHILLITDGRTYGDEDAALKLADSAAEKKIGISGLGIGSEWNDEFLDKLVSKTGGSSLYAANPKDIKNFLLKKFQSLSQTFADQVKINLKTPKDVELRYTFRLSPEPGALPNVSPLVLGSIPQQPSLSVIMDFVVNKISDQLQTLTLAEGELYLEIPTRKIPSTSSRISFIRPTGPETEIDPPPQGLIKAMSRLSLYRMQEQAKLDLQNGDLDKATQRLQNLATQLLASGEPALAHTVMLEIKNLEGGNSLSEESEKRIKYGTRSLLLPSGRENESL
jgi:Ca-activated chloride channel family protein